jgi:hypothetical protein
MNMEVLSLIGIQKLRIYVRKKSLYYVPPPQNNVSTMCVTFF